VRRACSIAERIRRLVFADSIRAKLTSSRTIIIPSSLDVSIGSCTEARWTPRGSQIDQSPLESAWERTSRSSFQNSTTS
jgi:hypothetical protein